VEECYMDSTNILYYQKNTCTKINSKNEDMQIDNFMSLEGYCQSNENDEVCDSLKCTENKDKGVGHYIENSNLYYHDASGDYSYEIPIPGFYMNICNSNKYIQCSSHASCQSKVLPTEIETCNSSKDGTIIKSENGFSVCTKINQLNADGTEITSNYVGIPFTASDPETNRYFIHHASEVFNFSHSTKNTYYIVSKNTTAIVFDPSYPDDDDQCANTSGLIIDRLTDFCSPNSSGMYYTCTTGHCTSEYQINEGEFESNGESFCSCAGGNASETCNHEKNVGYYYEEDTQYVYDGSSCRPVDTSKADIGFYWNDYQYNGVSQFDGEKFSPITPKVVTFDYCKGRKNKLVDTGFSLAFCNGDGEVISINKDFILTKGVSNTLFSKSNVYYILKNSGNSLVLDKSRNGQEVFEELEFNCNEGLCTLDNTHCVPESPDTSDQKGCLGYYLVSGQLYHCHDGTCEVKEDRIGYFKDSKDSNKAIKCTKSGTQITCSALDLPNESNNTCEKVGDLLYSNVGSHVKLCLDNTTKNAIEIFKEDTENYFMPGNILDTNLSNSSYSIIKVSENAVLTSTNQGRMYQYTFTGYKIITSKNQCNPSLPGNTVNDLVEYKREASGNTYTKN